MMAANTKADFSSSLSSSWPIFKTNVTVVTIVNVTTTIRYCYGIPFVLNIKYIPNNQNSMTEPLKMAIIFFEDLLCIKKSEICLYNIFTSPHLSHFLCFIPSKAWSKKVMYNILISNKARYKPLYTFTYLLWRGMEWLNSKLTLN